MLKPTPNVHVREWSRLMRIRRRFEVFVSDSRDPDDDENHVPISRHATRSEADRVAATVRLALYEAKR